MGGQLRSSYMATARSIRCSLTSQCLLAVYKEIILAVSHIIVVLGGEIVGAMSPRLAASSNERG